MILDVVKWYNPILETPGEEVTAFDSHLRELAQNMLETTDAHKGYGISGPQVGAPLRIFVMKLEKKPLNDSTAFQGSNPHLIVINPIIHISGKLNLMDEGCLSVPGVYNQVERSDVVQMQYYNVDKVLHEGKFSSIEARIIQHEVDHINGIMFFDRLSRQMRRSSLREWVKKGGVLKPE